VRISSLLLNKPINKYDSCQAKVKRQQHELGCCCQKFDKMICMESDCTDAGGGGRDENIPCSGCMFIDDMNLT